LVILKLTLQQYLVLKVSISLYSKFKFNKKLTQSGSTLIL